MMEIATASKSDKSTSTIHTVDNIGVKCKRPKLTDNSHDYDESKHLNNDESKEGTEQEKTRLISAGHDDDSETDNISEITPPKPSKYDLLAPLLKRLFHGQRPGTIAEQNEIREKSQISNYHASTLKIHPVEPKIMKKNYFDEPKYRYLNQCLYMIVELLNKRDLKGIESIIQDICLENCTLKTPALKEPVIGRDHIIELFRSFMRVCDDINDKILECTEDMLDDSVVITSHYILNGMLHTKYRYLLFKVVTNISYCKK